MRELNHHETQQVSGAGSHFSLKSLDMSNKSAASVTNTSTGWPPLDDLLTAVGNAFEKVAGILNYYTNLFK